MSELLADANRRKELLKHMIRQIHEGVAPDQVRTQLIRLLGQVPYGEVVEVEQELIEEGLGVEEILRLCDLHSAALEGAIDLTEAATAAPGHPVHTFRMENRALEWEIKELGKLSERAAELANDDDATELMAAARVRMNALMDVEKHYLRKEHLLFPFLEKHGVTGPPKVMWGKHDQTREKLRAAQEVLAAVETITAGEARGILGLVVIPAASAISEMIDKEEQILLPMCLDTLTDDEWLEIDRESADLGFCLYDPTVTWSPVGREPGSAGRGPGGPGRESGGAGSEATDPGELAKTRIRLPSGGMSVTELGAILNTIPFDLTFVDRDDTVRYFTQGRERIFARTRAILGRKVQFCHPPSSVKVVDRILSDFHTGRQDRAAFWITLQGRFIHIEYFALRDDAGVYLGCLEVSQDLTEKRALTGEQRLLSYGPGTIPVMDDPVTEGLVTEGPVVSGGSEGKRS